MTDDRNPGVGDNSSTVKDDLDRKWYRAALKAKQAQEKAAEFAKSAMSEYRTVLKDAKAAGVSTDAITYALKVRHMDQDELITLEQPKARMLAISGLWPSIQTSLFPSSIPEVEYTSEVAAEVAYDDGFQTGLKGGNRDHNRFPAGTENWEAFDRGWIYGQMENMPGKLKPAKPKKTKALVVPDEDDEDGEDMPEESVSDPLFN